MPSRGGWFGLSVMDAVLAPATRRNVYRVNGSAEGRITRDHCAVTGDWNNDLSPMSRSVDCHFTSFCHCSMACRVVRLPPLSGNPMRRTVSVGLTTHSVSPCSPRTLNPDFT